MDRYSRARRSRSGGQVKVGPVAVGEAVVARSGMVWLSQVR